MIELFAYKNSTGTKSVKIIGITGQSFDDEGKRITFGGISLGKVVLNSSCDLKEVLESLKNYEVLGHMPRRGEGLPEYNECFKIFREDRVYCKIGILDPKLLTEEDLRKTITFLKGLSETEEDKITESIKNNGSEHIPLPVLALISVASPSESVRLSSRTLIDRLYDEDDVAGVGIGIGIITGSPKKKVENESEVVKNLRALARSLGYDIVKL